jgi:hypothetical protein
VQPDGRIGVRIRLADAELHRIRAAVIRSINSVMRLAERGARSAARTARVGRCSTPKKSGCCAASRPTSHLFPHPCCPLLPPAAGGARCSRGLPSATERSVPMRLDYSKGGLQ